MLYAAKIANRSLTASVAQTARLVLSVALGVVIFMSARIGGLASFILARTAGDRAHVTIQAEAQDPARLGPAQGVLLAQGPATGHSAILRDTAALPGVSPQINDSGFMTRGGEVIQVLIMGLEPGRDSVIANLASYSLQGSADLTSRGVLLGKTLAEDLDASLGQQARLSSSQSVEALLTVTGIYQMGAGGKDRRQACVGLATARVLFQMPRGVTRVEIKLADLYAADAVAPQIKALTGLDAKSGSCAPWGWDAALSWRFSSFRAG